MQPSYAQDLGTGTIDVSFSHLARSTPYSPRSQHGCYGSMMNVLGECIGALGMIPCCPCPNPFNNISQGAVGLVSRFGQFYKVSYVPL